MKTPCSTDQAAFDAADLTPDLYNDAEDKADKNFELGILNEAVDNTNEAIVACSHCPLLEKCRKATLAAIDDSTPPCGVVQAGIYWGADARPDFTLNGCLTEDAAADLEERSNHSEAIATRTDDDGREWPLTVPVYSDLPNEQSTEKHGPVEHQLEPWDTSWIPAIPEPINTHTVELVCKKNDPHDAIPMARLYREHDFRTDGCEVLTDSDTCEVLRQLHAQGVTIRKISQRLHLHARTIKNLFSALGLHYENSEVHRRKAVLRERRKAALRKQREVVGHSQKAWDSTNDGDQLDLCAAVFDQELLKTA